MGHCDNPNCQATGPLARWETNELVVTINGNGAVVRSYCNDCLAHFMTGLHEHLPAPAPITEVTAQGETVVIGPEEAARRAAAEEASGR